jgi:hypothetical protein
MCSACAKKNPRACLSLQGKVAAINNRKPRKILSYVFTFHREATHKLLKYRRSSL